MRPARKPRLLAIAMLLLAVFSAMAGAAVSTIAYGKANLPYNEQGRFFDGVVVHHADAVSVYTALAALVWLIALLFAALAYRQFKRTRADSAPERWLDGS